MWKIAFEKFEVIKQTILLQIFNDCFPQILLGPFLNTLIQIFISSTVLKPFLANVFVLHPLKAPENQRFSGVFRRYKMGALVRNGLIVLEKYFARNRFLKECYWLKSLLDSPKLRSKESYWLKSLLDSPKLGSNIKYTSNGFLNHNLIILDLNEDMRFFYYLRTLWFRILLFKAWVCYFSSFSPNDSF